MGWRFFLPGDVVFCLLRGLWRTWKSRARTRNWTAIEGHDWANEEEDIPALVTISRCETCGITDMVWRRQGR